MSYQTREKGTDEKERKKTPHLLSSTRKKPKRTLILRFESKVRHKCDTISAIYTSHKTYPQSLSFFRHFATKLQKLSKHVILFASKP